MTKSPQQRWKWPANNGKLTDVDKPLRTTTKPPGSQCKMLKGSRGAPTVAKPKPHKGPPKYTPAKPYTHNALYQCAPGERVEGAGFAAAGLGVDIVTGKPWGMR